jgi:DNA polymerase III alpha subunit
MRTDIYGQVVMSEDDICSLLLQNPLKNLKNLIIDEPINLNTDLELPKLDFEVYSELNLPIQDFDALQQNIWHMPDHYKNMDIAKWVLDQCKNNDELQRVGKELLMFQERNMFTLLKYLKFLVDTMKENNIVYGVGRGSSVSSFVLYLIGIHRINSLYYDLDIEEFLK